MMFTARVEVQLKKGISDPEGNNILKALHLLGFDEVEDVSVAKVTRLVVSGDSEDVVRDRVEEMCQRLLTNPVIHDYTVELQEDMDD
ncbi:MAG: phosphoribosylformylglycinamidine synthase subunit PurS [Candidatus Thermoplasmatota archaeon]|nr:phosphoribosylformylglycinamidine synthase subunit PurS [Candidatus Thermoplasmatota archaeon]